MRRRRGVHLVNRLLAFGVPWRVPGCRPGTVRAPQASSSRGPRHPECALCGGAREPAGSTCGSLCSGCHAQLPRIDATACPRCARPGVGGLTCGACLSHPPGQDAVVAALRYSFPVPEIISRFKYGARLAWSAWASRELADAVLGRQAHSRVDLLVAVPLGRARLAQRGFNQAELLAAGVAAACGLPHQPGALVRVRETAPQVGLDREARLRNLRGAFRHSARPAARLAGLRLAVIDDVMTTGATLESIARAAREAGAVHVEGWMLARAEASHV